MHLTPTDIIIDLLVLFIAWRFIQRLRRNIGRQPVRPRRMTLRMIFFGGVTLVLVMYLPHETHFMLALGGGLLAGVLLALLGLRLTRFENNHEGRFFTPNTFMGLAISLLLVVRLVYRTIVLYGAVQKSGGKPPPGLLQSPLTVLLFGMVAGYYIVYYAGIFICCGKPDPATTNA